MTTVSFDTQVFDDLVGPAPSRETSEQFRAGDADVTFVSSDNILFYIHRKNLETHAAAFPSAEFDTRGEIVPLTEDASTLELLFQFVYPRRHPDLEATPFEALAPLAEAAEKYEVFSAMNICKIRMRNFLPDHAAEVANYASRHGYKDLLGGAAPFLLDLPLDEIVTILSLDIVVPWVRYRERWSRAAFEALAELPSGTHYMNGPLIICSTCGQYVRNGVSIAQAWVDLGNKRSRSVLESLYDCPGRRDPCVGRSVISAHLDKKLGQVPAFEIFF